MRYKVILPLSYERSEQYLAEPTDYRTTDYRTTDYRTTYYRTTYYLTTDYRTMFHPTPIPGLLVFEPRVFGDERGYFFESYNEQTFHAAGIDCTFVQDNQAKSTRGVLRGMHLQTGDHAQAKLVRVISGEVFDVAVDLRPDSPTRGQWFGVYLSGENNKQLFVPRGFAHGYLVTSDEAVFAYKCDNFYAPQAEGGLRYDDPAVSIEWPEVGVEYIVAERDLGWSPLRLGRGVRPTDATPR